MSKNHGKVWWSELMTDDPDGAAKWWADMAGWEYDEMEMPQGKYRVAKLNGEGIAGIMARPAAVPKEIPAHWLTYVAVDNVDEAIKKAPAVMNEPFDVPNVGRIAVVADGGGAPVGLITPAHD